MKKNSYFNLILVYKLINFSVVFEVKKKEGMVETSVIRSVYSRHL